MLMDEDARTSDRPKSPLMATVNVTGNCNLNCNYCFNVPRETIDIALDDFTYVISTLKQEEVFLIVLSGGEPFVHPLIDDLLVIAHDTFDHVQILSNGTTLTPKNIDTISRVIESKGYFPIQISLDSHISDINLKTRSNNGTVLENIARLHELGANITISTVITNRNIENIPETIAVMSAYAQSFHVMPFKRQKFNRLTQDLEANPGAIEALWKALEKLRGEKDLNLNIPCADTDDAYCADGAPCMAGFSHIVVDPNLKVRACDRCTTNMIGDLKESSFSEIWNGRKIEAFYSLDRPFCMMQD